MKMSDVFELPVHDHEFLYADDTDMHSKAAAHAVNCHDDLVACLELMEKWCRESGYPTMSARTALSNARMEVNE